jgi:DNA uptake protein ComE-like DNA-binding protein
MKTKIQNYLRFNRSERNGTLALFILATLLFALPEVARHFKSPQHTDFEPFQREIKAFKASLGGEEKASPKGSHSLFTFDPNTVSLKELLQLGLSDKTARSICKYRDKGGKFRQAADFQKIWNLEKADYERLLPYIQIGAPAKPASNAETETAQPESFTFDPNTATEADFKRLGLPERTVKSILHYREKGGQFRKKEDLEKIYTLDEADYARIADFARFPEPMASAKPSSGGMAFTDRPHYPTKKPEGPVDINQASLEAWRSLPGIGEMRARQLVNYREKLGGFLSIDQVGEMIGFPDSVFQTIKPFLVIGSPGIKKINLNSASIADLDAHPYISKRQAELIVAYREQHGAFASPEDIGKMRAIADKSWLAKVRPYLGVD